MLILASASLRRQELLAIITPEFRIITADVDETIPNGTPPHTAVEMIALRKAQLIANAHPSDIVIGADTVVVIDNTILGKPKDIADATSMLKRLSGRQHVVYTGVAICHMGEVTLFNQSTNVRFNPLSEGEIARYIQTGEPFDKAGGYGIQGKGALLVAGIQGDYYNVMGLPLSKLYKFLTKYCIF